MSKKAAFSFCVFLLLGLAASTPSVGGTKPVDVNDKDVQDAATHAVALISAESDSRNKLALVRVISGTKQVVAGMKYQLLVEFGTSKCSKNSLSDSACPLLDSTQTSMYDVEIWWQSWRTPQYQLLSFSQSQLNGV